MSTWFWHDRWWLPGPTTSWNDFRSSETVKYPQLEDLTFAFTLGLTLFLWRIILTSLVNWKDLTEKLGKSRQVRRATDRPLSVPPKVTMKNLQCSPLREICSRPRRNGAKFKSLAENLWCLAFKCGLLVFGAGALWKEAFFWNLQECWDGWPREHTISHGIYWYYMLEIGFYWTLMFSIILDAERRNDFRLMLIHHLLALILLSVSWLINFARIGSLILITHDASDCLMETIKLMRQFKFRRSAVSVVFSIYFLTWTVTRLVYFPFWILHSIIFDLPFSTQVRFAFIRQNIFQADAHWFAVIRLPFAVCLMVVLLFSLLLMHIYWTFLLVKVSSRLIWTGELRDVREPKAE